MDTNTNKEYNLYSDIQVRTGGEIYIGVVGPVGTGKSTFIKRFMELLVLPVMNDEHAKMRAQDELPQSAGGKTITTTEPKFIPKEAAEVILQDGISAKIRLIDCVGYMIQGAVGHLEEEQERMVKTPWFDHDIPFTQAAELGTDKVIRDHSTIGLVITTDGSFTELPRESYLEAEEKTIMTLKRIRKPFMVLLNTAKPYSEEAKRLAKEIGTKYQVGVIPVNCEQLKKEDIHMIMENILYEFPLSTVEFYMPKWVELQAKENRIKQDIIAQVREFMKGTDCIRNVMNSPVTLESDYIKRSKIEEVNPSNGKVKIILDVDESYYYEMLSELVGNTINSEYELIHLLQEFSKMKKEYVKVQDAVQSVRMKGYGVVMPDREEIVLNQPEVIKHGNKFGVKIKAESPSVHMIRANIETEIAPIVGTEEQANDLIKYISDAQVNEDGLWETNIFGKTVEQLVNDGIVSKIAMIGDESQLKLQETMQKIVNDSNGGMVCIII